MTGTERREQLLGIGRKLFAERGFEGTSIEEIAAQAGVSKPVVYEHFGGKEGLYAVVVDREVERFLTLATRLLQGEDTMEKFEVAAGDVLKARGYDPKLAPMYAQMLVGMVAFTGQWWLDARKPKLEVVAGHLMNLAWN